jgi:hypothetical protein
MNSNLNNKALQALVDELDVSDSSYELAKRRYEDLGNWLHDKSRARSAAYLPQVFPQGSFRLGTAIKPWRDGEYDLDLACRFQVGISTSTHTQEQLKTILGDDLAAYRRERQIQEKLEERHRCWRLHYRDELQFHLDALPGIPQEQGVRRLLKERMVLAGTAESLANEVAELAMAITDDRRPDYRMVSTDWNISNPEGYARWFISQMRLGRDALERRALIEHVASVDKLPIYRWKTPLQQAVQVLKRHRDIMFADNPDSKPISVIITTLTAQAYDGASDLAIALDTILRTMGSKIRASRPRVPNPVNPAEDFADKWPTPEGQRLRLEENFFTWLRQAQTDFETLARSGDRKRLTETAALHFGVTLGSAIQIEASAASAPTPVSVHIVTPAKPWRV